MFVISVVDFVLSKPPEADVHFDRAILE